MTHQKNLLRNAFAAHFTNKKLDLCMSAKMLI